jgi:hypothetical protein
MGFIHITRTERQKEKFNDILRNPWRSALGEILEDLNYEPLFSGSKKKRSRLNDLTALLSFGLISIPHELIHAGVNLFTGGKNAEIVINRLYGGDLVHLINFNVQSKLLIPLIGGYVYPFSYGSEVGKAAVSVAPYVLTPIGIYLMQKARENSSLSLAVAGAGALVIHCGGILGDFFKFGRDTFYNAANGYAYLFGFDSYNTHNFWMAFPLTVGGFYLGSKVCSLSYRLSKAGVNYCRSALKKKSVESQHS